MTSSLRLPPATRFVRLARLLLVGSLAVAIASVACVRIAAAAPHYADSFVSNGDEIEGWYWLRDADLNQTAEYLFTDIPQQGDITLQITALATDRASGGPGFDARFELIYGFPGTGRMGGVFQVMTVVLPNVSPEGDPLGYLTRDTVTLPRELVDQVLPQSGALYIRVKRLDAADHHVAFNRDSIVMTAAGEAATTEAQGGFELPDTTSAADAVAILPGDYTGALDLTVDDSDDWYSLEVERGQIIHLTLTMPGSMSGSLRLITPAGATRRDVYAGYGSRAEITYAATETGTWSVHIVRSHGNGTYRLSYELIDQDDAGYGTDAGPAADTALLLDDGPYSGQLPVGDDADWYRISLEAGDILHINLAALDSLRAIVELRSPTGATRQTIDALPGEAEAFDYAADIRGDWLIRIRRVSGFGHYTLTLARDQQNDGGGYGDAGATAEEAVALEPGDQFGQLLPRDDRDRYTISADRGDIIDFTANSLTDTLRFAMGILSPTGASLAGAAVNPFDNVDLRYAATSDGEWLLDLRRLAGAGPYGINAEVHSQNDGDAGFDAGTCTTAPAPLAIPVTNGQLLAGDTVDCYAISLNANQHLSATLATDDNLSAYVTLRSGSAVVGPVTGEDGIPRIDFVRDHPNDVFLIVNRRNGDGPYRLDVTLTPPNAGPGVASGGEAASGAVASGAASGAPGSGVTPSGGEEGATAPPITVAISDGGRILSASAPFEGATGLRDPDGDGLDQTWEDAVMEAAIPMLELDEEETWLRRQPGHHVVQFVRITPYTATTTGQQYILVNIAIAWTADYGRFATGIPAWDENIAIRHNGDVERVILAYRITSDTTIDLDAVYTSAHGGPTNHSGVWGARGQSCNDGKVALGPDQTICSAIQFTGNRLLLQISQDKHAIYPSPQACEDVRLVLQLALPLPFGGTTGFGEDCGDGPQLVVQSFNVGEPNNHIDIDISAIFPGEQVWGGDGFCGGRGPTYDANLPCVGPIDNSLGDPPSLLRDWLARRGEDTTILQNLLQGPLDLLQNLLPNIDIPGVEDIPDILPDIPGLSGFLGGFSL